MIRLLHGRDVAALVQHLLRHMPRSGVDGPRYTPHPRTKAYDGEQMRAQYTDAIGRVLSEPQWRRVFGLFDAEVIVGHLELNGGRIVSEMHRASLALGLELAHRGRGHGLRLMTTAIAWAREQGLDWIDLGVFETNAPALKLYAQLGFVRTGIIIDRFRADGESIDDIQMSLQLTTNGREARSRQPR